MIIRKTVSVDRDLWETAMHAATTEGHANFSKIISKALAKEVGFHEAERR